MRVSIIVAVYKDIEALDVIIESLREQTYKNFEVIIAEDGNSKEMAKYVSTIKDLNIIHTTQEDIGIRKSKSQNNAIRAANGDYLIFIDGDCVLYSTFIEYHVKLAQKGYFVGGRRVNLGPKYSNLLRQKKIKPIELEKSFLWRFISISKDALEGHTEEGFCYKPNSFIHKIIQKLKKGKKLRLLGCNFGCFKDDIVAINGFDEDLKDAAVAADTDIQWRLEAIGLKMKSCKNIANQFHLYHQRSSDQDRAYPRLFIEKKKRNEYICKNGIKKL